MSSFSPGLEMALRGGDEDVDRIDEGLMERAVTAPGQSADTATAAASAATCGFGIGAARSQSARTSPTLKIFRIILWALPSGYDLCMTWRVPFVQEACPVEVVN